MRFHGLPPLRLAPEGRAHESRSCGLTTLADLFPEARGSEHAGRTVSGLTADSRKVRPGSVFVAVPGTKADGAAFIPQALAAGAMAIVGEAERPATLNAAIAYLRVADVRRALALAAARFFPRQPETVVAVTGTSGKSSVADFVRQLFAALGHRSASLGTLGVITSAGASYGSLTTPDPVALHETLDRLAGDAHHPSGHGGVLARHRAAPARRRAPQGRGLHQSRPRPPRLSRHDRRLPAGEAAPVRGPPPAGHRRGRQRRRRHGRAFPRSRRRARLARAHHRTGRRQR